MNRALIAAIVLLGACSNSTDPCAGSPGACVALTVTSSQIHTSIDTLAFTAMGAVTGTQTTTTSKKPTLPFKVALRFGAGKSGDVQLAVVASSGGSMLGQGHVAITIPVSGHTSATVDVEPDGSDGGIADLFGVDGGAFDMKPALCDPHGLSGAACVWRWQSPLPVGEDLRSVWAFADNDIFALSESGAILHSDGKTWSILPARPKPASGTFRALKMKGGLTDLYILGFNSGSGQPSEVFHSMDKGASWLEEMLPSSANNIMTDIAVIPGPDDSGVVVVGGFAHITTRGPNGTWTDDQLTCVGMSGCSTNFNVVTASLLDQIAIYSPTGGYAGQNTTWSPLTGLTGTNTYNALCNGHDFLNTNIRYWGVGYNGVIASATQSAPTSWSMQTSPTSALLYGCAASDQNKAWAFGANGTLIASTNGGTSWAALPTGTTNLLLSGSHSPGATLTVVGTGGVILQGLDGAGTFTNKQTGTSGVFNAIYGVAPNNLYAVGGNGTIAHSTDGQTWTGIVASGATQNFTAVWGSSPTDVYAVGFGGTLVHSSDGSSFVRYTNPGAGGIPATANLTGIAGLSASNVLVSSDEGLFRSTDGGSSFASVTIAGFAGPAVHTVFVLGSDAWIGGDNGQIYHSTDGAAWTSQTLTGIGATLPITTITGRAGPSSASGELFAASADSTLLARTTNNGATWTNSLVDSLGGRPLYQVALTPLGDYLYAQSNVLLVSQDHGVNFVPVVTAPVPSEVGALFIAGVADIYAASASGIVHFGN